MCDSGELAFAARQRWIASSRYEHRGPDGRASQDGALALGHRRLSIIDLARGAASRCRTRRALRGSPSTARSTTTASCARSFARIGHEFRTDSDTEVILAAYHAWGGRGARAAGRDVRLRRSGTGSPRELLLARDQLGVKPLLYHQDERGVLFASELKPLLEHPAVAARARPRGARAVPRARLHADAADADPRRPEAPARALPAAARRAGRAAMAYWDLAAALRARGGGRRLEREPWPRSSATCSSALSKMQMVSDVPLGAFLTGGIDSSTITYFAAKHAPGAARDLLDRLRRSRATTSPPIRRGARRCSAWSTASASRGAGAPTSSAGSSGTTTSRSATPRSCRPTSWRAARGST